jgi:hypothetical protein
MDDVFDECVQPCVDTFLQGKDVVIVCCGGSRSQSETVSLVHQTAASLLRSLNVVPRHRYVLNASYCGTFGLS